MWACCLCNIWKSFFIGLLGPTLLDLQSKQWVSEGFLCFMRIDLFVIVTETFVHHQRLPSNFGLINFLFTFPITSSSCIVWLFISHWDYNHWILFHRFLKVKYLFKYYVFSLPIRCSLLMWAMFIMYSAASQVPWKRIYASQ